MTDLPILFSAPMVRALLDGRKAMTRHLAWRRSKSADYKGRIPTSWMKVFSGDRLWVRERARVIETASRDYINSHIRVRYEADGFESDWIEFPVRLKYAPIVGQCLNMGTYRESSRLTLVVTATKVERLQDISDDDVRAEGIACRECNGLGSYLPTFSANYLVACRTCIAAAEKRGVTILSGQMAKQNLKKSFEMMWTHLHGPESWNANPEVVAIRFTVHKCNIDSIPQGAPPHE